MKKIILLITVLMVTLTIANASESVIQPMKNAQEISKMRAQREASFEKRLGLTEEQKTKAKEMRIRSHAKMKPLIEQIAAKKQEARMVKMSRIAVQVQEEKLAIIDKELKELEKKVHDLRKSNMKEFESILTREQKKILKQMKKEGRQRYHANHPVQKPVLTLPSVLHK